MCRLHPAAAFNSNLSVFEPRMGGCGGVQPPPLGNNQFSDLFKVRVCGTRLG